MGPNDAVLGVDGCPGGWVGALVTARSVEWLVLPDAAAVLAVGEVATGIDIPIGLPDSAPRPCDLEARRRLGPRRSSVFPAPMRAVLECPGYAEACAASRAASGRALSLQAWHLVPRIADVDRSLSAEDHRRVVEVHPELVFAHLAGVLPPKKSPAGRAAREAAMRVWLPDGWPPHARPARSDDALDALACAWAARRWLDGQADVLGGERDSRGVPMRIVC